MVSSVLFYYPEYVHSDAGVGVYLHWSDLLQEVAMLYPLQCLSFVLYIEGTKNEIVDEHELARGQNQTLQIYRGPKMQKDEDMILQVHGIRLNRHSDLAEDSGEHGAIDWSFLFISDLWINWSVILSLHQGQPLLRQRCTSIFFFEIVNKYNIRSCY